VQIKTAQLTKLTVAGQLATQMLDRLVLENNAGQN